MILNKNHMHNIQNNGESRRELMNRRLEGKVNQIYERCHKGKTVTIDDFRFLVRQDPEGCEKLIHGVLSDKDVKKTNPFESENDILEYIQQLEFELELARARLHTIDKKTEEEKKIYHVQKSLENMKEMFCKMDDSEKMDMMEHLYEVTTLMEQYEQEILEWEEENEKNPYQVKDFDTKTNYFI